MLESLLFWEAVSFVVFLTIGLLFVRAIRRRTVQQEGANSSRDTTGQDGVSAEEILERRYANGEITREEYLTIQDDITRKPYA